MKTGWCQAVGDRDGVAEGFELADVAVLPGFRVGVAVEVIGAEVMELCVRVRITSSRTVDRLRCRARLRRTAGEPLRALSNGGQG